MKDGYIKVAACTPEIRVADCEYNARQIVEMAKSACEQGAKICVFPELCITGYTCNDLFFQDTLLDGAMEALAEITNALAGLDCLFAVGLPVSAMGKLYNCAAVIKDGEVCAFVPKTHLPNYNEFCEARHFAAYDGTITEINLERWGCNIGKNCSGYADFGQYIFRFDGIDGLAVGFEICEDLWVCDPVSNYLAKNGANIICNLSASSEAVGKASYRRQLVSNQSARLVCGYVYCSAGNGESTQDLVFSGHNIIAEDGAILKESKLFENGITISEIDIKKLNFERRKISTFPHQKSGDSCDDNAVTREFFYPITLKIGETPLTRHIPKSPFIPSDKAECAERCQLILQMQSHGLMKRISHTNSKTVVIGISGGLDSTLALLVCVEAMDLLKRPRTDVVAVTMPCFGTTKRTRSNAEILCESLGVTFREVNITKSVLQHFEDIGHDANDHSVVFENAQARERTKVLMDIANQMGGLVVGTGDLSELALGWATYNGDHMSMYGVNASVPKTLIRYIVRYYAEKCGSKTLSEVLIDVVDTPVSPELLPTDESATEMTQKTEDLVGPYELHDFFLYYAIRWGFEPKKVYRLAKYAFDGDYDNETILKWLKKFYWRFFSQQFKRSCLPDGAKIGSISLSPRGDWQMPSDASVKLWYDQAESLEP